MNSQRFAAVALLALAFNMAFQAREIRSQEPEPTYPHMAPIDQYLMDRNAEIALVRSAAPDSISRAAQVLVLSRRGYENAVEGSNGFVCVVERSWMLPFDDPGFWSPTVRLPLCINPPGARSHLPLTFRAAELALSGVSNKDMSERLKTAYNNKELPLPEPGSMCYMMSKQQYFGDNVGNAGGSHLMFWFPQGEQLAWGRRRL